MYGNGCQYGSVLIIRWNKRKASGTSKCRDQPSGGAQGQATEIEIAAEHILRTKKKLNTILSENTGQPYETIVKDTERDNWLTAQEALEYGLIDKVMEKR